MAEAHHPDDNHTHAVASIAGYITVFVLLLLMTAATVGVAYIELGAWNMPAALAIATCKAALVAAFFMHLRGSSPLHTLAISGAFLWVILLMMLTLGDYNTRKTLVPAGNFPDQQPPRKLVLPAEDHGEQH